MITAGQIDKTGLHALLLQSDLKQLIEAMGTEKKDQVRIECLSKNIYSRYKVIQLCFINHMITQTQYEGFMQMLKEALDGQVKIDNQHWDTDEVRKEVERYIA